MYWYLDGGRNVPDFTQVCGDHNLNEDTSVVGLLHKRAIFRPFVVLHIYHATIRPQCTSPPLSYPHSQPLFIFSLYNHLAHGRPRTFSIASPDDPLSHRVPHLPHRSRTSPS